MSSSTESDPERSGNSERGLGNHLLGGRSHGQQCVRPGRQRTPSFKAGHSQGVDLGLRQALDIVCKEWAAQVDHVIVAGLEADPRRTDAARYEYCASRLHAVAAIVGATFRVRPS
jgi:hypothetical protein